MTSGEPVLLRLGAARRLTHALPWLTDGATQEVLGRVTGLLVQAALGEGVTTHFIFHEVALLLVMRDGVEVFSSLSVNGTLRPPCVLSSCCPGPVGALLVCGVYGQGRVAPLFMAMTQRMAEVNPNAVVHSIFTVEKIVSVHPDDGDGFPASVTSSSLKEALGWNCELDAAQTHICLAGLSAGLCLTSGHVKACGFLGLQLPQRSVVSMARAAQQGQAWPVRELLGARVASFEAVKPENRSPAVQTEPAAVHSNTRRWSLCLMVLLTGLLLALLLICEANSSQSIIKWVASHFLLCRCLVTARAGTCWRVSVTSLHHICHQLWLLVRGSSHCFTKLLQSDSLLILVTLPCCSLLHFAVTAVLMWVRPVRHAVRRLEERLLRCPRPVVVAARVLWRCLVTASITCVIAAVAARAW